MSKPVWIALVLATGIAALGQQPAKPLPPKVVFVCEHGSAKSVIAAAEFERMAKERGVAVQVVSRGTNPDAEIGPAIRQGLHADGIDVGAAAKPIKVSAKDLEGAAKVVSFGPDLAERLPKGAKAADWSATPSPGKDYRAARDYIVKRMESLLAELPK